MKLLLINYEFPPMGGGAASATYEIARELVSLGHSVDVLTSKFGNQLDKETIDGIKVFRVNSWRHGIHQAGISGALTFIFFGFLKLRRLMDGKQYDLVHYFFSLPTAVLSFYTFDIKKIPYIVSLRGSDVPGYDRSDLKLKGLHRILKPLTRRIWRNATKVIANSNGLRDLALETLKEQPIGVIYNGVDSIVFSPISGLKEQSNSLRLICVSRLIERKGLDYVIEAVDKLREPSIKVDIVGSGSCDRRLKDKVKMLGMHNQILFHGYRSNTELINLYNAADIFIQCSLSESLNMALLEAMSCGLPVVVSRVGGVPEIIEDGENGILVKSRDVEETARAILLLVNNSLLRNKISKANINKIREKFEWKRAAIQYQDVYTGIINNQG